MFFMDVSTFSHGLNEKWNISEILRNLKGNILRKPRMIATQKHQQLSHLERRSFFFFQNGNGAISSGGSRLCLCFVGVDFGRSGGRIVGLVGTRSWDRCVGCRGSNAEPAAPGEVALLLSVVSCCLGARVVGSCGTRPRGRCVASCCTDFRLIFLINWSFS
jgi:hypothetical protein